MSDVVAGLSGRQLFCFRAEFLECRPGLFQRSAFGQLNAFRAELTSCCFRAAKIIGYQRGVSFLVAGKELLVFIRQGRRASGRTGERNANSDERDQVCDSKFFHLSSMYELRFR